jgi:hypothetical protein
MSASFDELASLAEALSVLGMRARAASMRSRRSAAAVIAPRSGILQAARYSAEHMDARDVFVTDDNFMSAEPGPNAIAEAARDLVPLIEGRCH